MEIREIPFRARWTLNGVDIRLQLDQIAGHETRGETKSTQDLDEKPCRIAT